MRRFCAKFEYSDMPLLPRFLRGVSTFAFAGLVFDVAVVFLGHNIGLLIERVLVQGNELLVLEQVQRSSLDGGQVAANEQGRVHDAPHSKVGLVFFCGERASHFEHVHVVEVAIGGVGAHVEVFGNNAFHRVP